VKIKIALESITYNMNRKTHHANFVITNTDNPDENHEVYVTLCANESATFTTEELSSPTPEED
jgi:hypothetical protein